GNPPGDLATVRPCGAKTRRATACEGPAMKNGRCRMHGGMSTGPRTPEGRERSRQARWKHGAYSQETKSLLRESRRQWRELLALLFERFTKNQRSAQRNRNELVDAPPASLNRIPVAK